MSVNRKTRNIALTPEQDDFVERLLTDGRYQSASELFRHALRCLEDDINMRQAELDEIRTRISQSMADYRRGDFVEGKPDDIVSAVFERVRKQHGL